jgi:preprotein translocase subunit SecD
MEKSWWWKAALYGTLTLLSCLYLIPTIYRLSGIPDDKQPAFIRSVFTKKIQYGLDLQGGLHLVYQVNVDKAVQSKVDTLANIVEDAVKKKAPDVTVTREGRDDVVVRFKNPADTAKLDASILNENRELDEVERDAAAGVVRLRFDQDLIKEVEDSALRQAIEIIRNRVDQFGVSEPTIIPKDRNIVVELPGLDEKDFERIVNIIGKTAQLEFRIVEEGSPYMTKVAALLPKDGPVKVQVESYRNEKTGAAGETVYLQAKNRADLDKFIAGLTGENAVPPDLRFGLQEIEERREDETPTGQTSWRTLLLKRRVGMTGEYLASADVGWDEMGRAEVLFRMNPQGADKMGQLTGQNVGSKMAIVLDDRITSAPVIQSQINESGRITLGTFGDPATLMKEAQDLVAVLRSGALPAPLQKVYQSQIGRTLGDDAIEKAKLSMYIGAAAVILFMLVYYRKAGIIANIAMLLNMVYMLAILAMFEASLTLPGIAGLVLTIGMAVDANIVIYERIREELRRGKSPRSAVDAGFDRAFWTVFDAHVTNFVAGIVLYSYGSGPIRGFAVTLLVGIVSNLLTSVWISRWMFDLLVGRRRAAAATLSI